MGRLCWKYQSHAKGTSVFATRNRPASIILKELSCTCMEKFPAASTFPESSAKNLCGRKHKASYGMYTSQQQCAVVVVVCCYYCWWWWCCFHAWKLLPPYIQGRTYHQISRQRIRYNSEAAMISSVPAPTLRCVSLST